MTRYDRQTMLAEVGEAGQRRLGAARVLIVGVGGLGSPAALYLAGAGVGTIVVADDDAVSVSNLQRQILYRECDEGLPKAGCAARRLAELNGGIRVEAVTARITAGNIRAMISSCDAVVDGCDNFATRYAVGDATAEMGVPYVYGAIGEFEGQVSVFNYGPRPRRYRDLWPDEEAAVRMRPAKGVMGPTAAVTGAVEASETLKILCGYGEVLAGRLWTIDMLTMRSEIVELP